MSLADSFDEKLELGSLPRLLPEPLLEEVLELQGLVISDLPTGFKLQNASKASELCWVASGGPRALVLKARVIGVGSKLKALTWSVELLERPKAWSYEVGRGDYINA